MKLMLSENSMKGKKMLALEYQSCAESLSER